jgi:hypothetical protein
VNRTLLNLVTFYLGWFACVWGAASQRPLVGPFVTLLVLGVHFCFIPNAAREARLITTVGLIGLGLDTVQASLGAFSFTGTGLTTWLSPPWMIALWMNFATTLHTSLSWLAGRYLLAALLGVVGGPLSYYAGAQLGALTLHPNVIFSISIVAVAWGSVMPILVWLAHRQEVRSSRVKQSLLLGTILLFLVAPITWAATIEGVTFPERHQIEDTTLHLNNVGLLRYRIFIKAYVAALYLGEGVRTEDVLADVPKRLELQYFWALAGPDFGKAADQLLSENVPAETLRDLRPRIERLHALYENVKPGDRYTLTYIPGRGTELALNGIRKDTIEGADFAAAYFAIWLGPKPLNAALKAQLLSRSAP